MKWTSIAHLVCCECGGHGWVVVPEYDVPLGGISPGQAISLLLYGPTGRGKTMLLIALLNELGTKWPRGHYLYWTMAEFQESRRSSIDGGHQDPIVAAKEADVVCLDDLGVEQTTPYGLDGLNRLVDWRWSNRRPLLIATNLSLGGAKAVRAFQERYDPRIVSRFYCDTARIAEISGPNWRVEQGKGELADVNWAPSEMEEGGAPPESVREILATLGGKKRDGEMGRC